MDKYKYLHMDLKEDITVGADIDTSNIDGCVFALAKYLDKDPGLIIKEYPEDDSVSEDGRMYLVLKEDYESEDDWEECWLVFPANEYSDFWDIAKDKRKNSIYYDDITLYYSIDTLMDYLPSDFYDQDMQDDIHWRVDDMDFDELIEEMEDRYIISEDDMVQDPDWEPDEDVPPEEQEPDMVYDPDFIESKKDELEEAMYDDYPSGLDYFLEIFGKRELEDYIRENPDVIDIDQLVDDELDMGSELAYYDSEECWETLTPEEDDWPEKETYYLYQRD